MNYFEEPALTGLYLEDSYVLGIEETSESLTFSMDFVLTEEHPDYRPPPADEQYCYLRGALRFEKPSVVEWLNRNFQVYTDANGDQDLGNIDYLLREGNRWRAGGDWGEVVVRTGMTPQVTLNNQR